MIDFSINYKTNRFKLGLTIENVLNAEWNEAQFATESKLQFESKAVDELHFTAGTPLSAKITIGYIF